MPKTATPRPLTEAEKRQRYARLTEQAKREREASMSPLARMLGFGDAERGLVRDTASAANDVAGRGVMASLIGLPGDLAGMGENGIRGLLGLPQVQPWGGSEHIGQTMQDYGLVSSERRPKTELLASLVSPSAAVKTAVNAPKTAMNLLRMADNWDAPRTMARYGERGAIDVWHGSPHTFDQFRAMDNMGAGEGAHAYGYGGYHASSPEVARSYQDALGVKHVDSSGNRLDINKVRADVYAAVKVGGGTEDEAFMASNEVPFAISSGDLSRLPKPAADVISGIGAKQVNDGNLYRNQLRWPDPAREAADPLSDKHFLDWDRPLSEQGYALERLRGSEFLKNQLKSGGFYQSDIDSGLVEGRHLVSPKRSGVREESAALRELGIPGIRYLDGGSRGAGQGTYNYVTFDDSLVNILERNGQPVSAPQPGLLGRMVAPQDEALRIAQQNAAKPVSEGGLGNMIGGDDYDVIRYDAEGDIPTFDKPHGIYTTPAGVASPHTGVGGNVSKWKLNPDAKVLNIQIDDGPSLAMRPGAKGAGGGVATVRHLLGQDTFNSIKGLKKDQLIDWIGKNTDFDPATFSNYYDSQEVMEGLGGLLARKNGYSAISYADRTPFWSSPEWDERILLSEEAVRK